MKEIFFGRFHFIPRHGGKVILALLCAMVVFSACSGKSGKSGDTGSAQEKKPAHLIVWMNYQSMWDATEKGFNDANPDKPVDIEMIPVNAGDYLPKLQQSYASNGDLPDILTGEMSYRAAAFEMDVWEDLEASPYNVDRNLFFEYVLGNNINSKGQLVGIENAQNPVGVAYKRNLAKQYLSTDDPQDVSSMLTTYDDMINVGRKVYEESGGKIRLFAGLNDIATMMFAQQQNVGNVDNDGNINVSGKILPILQLIEKARGGQVAGNLATYSAQYNAEISGDSYIMYNCPQWAVAFIIEPNDPDGIGNWGIARAPGGAYSSGGTCYGISKTSENKAEAWDVISWILMTKGGAKIMLDEVGVLLPLKSLYDDPTYTQGTRPHFGVQQINKFFIEDIATQIKPNIMSIYDSMIRESLTMVVSAMTADASITASLAMKAFIEDLQSKVDVQVK
jgi:multiple sugar transport system substrate-binding protein